VPHSGVFFMKDTPEAGLDDVLRCHPGQAELRKVVLKPAIQLTSDCGYAA
jgi:hypothetical protein